MKTAGRLRIVSVAAGFPSPILRGKPSDVGNEHHGRPPKRSRHREQLIRYESDASFSRDRSAVKGPGSYPPLAGSRCHTWVSRAEVDK